MPKAMAFDAPQAVILVYFERKFFLFLFFSRQALP